MKKKIGSSEKEEREREKSNLLTHAHLKFGLAIKSRT